MPQPILWTPKQEWTDARVEELKRMVAERWSGGAIAKAMGTTRNAVIGKAHRLKLKLLNQTGQTGSTGPRQKRDRQDTGWHRNLRSRLGPKPTKVNMPGMANSLRNRRNAPGYTDKEPAAPPEAKMLPLLALTDTTCKYPIGHPGSQPFGFCGDDIKFGEIYCGFHRMICHAPLVRRERSNHVVTNFGGL